MSTTGDAEWKFYFVSARSEKVKHEKFIDISHNNWVF
jgi:hypothetical protein